MGPSLSAKRPAAQWNALRQADAAVDQDKFARHPTDRLNGLRRELALVVEQGDVRREFSLRSRKHTVALQRFTQGALEAHETLWRLPGAQDTGVISSPRLEALDEVESHLERGRGQRGGGLLRGVDDALRHTGEVPEVVKRHMQSIAPQHRTGQPLFRAHPLPQRRDALGCEGIRKHGEEKAIVPWRRLDAKERKLLRHGVWVVRQATRSKLFGSREGRPHPFLFARGDRKPLRNLRPLPNHARKADHDLAGVLAVQPKVWRDG